MLVSPTVHKKISPCDVNLIVSLHLMTNIVYFPGGIVVIRTMSQSVCVSYGLIIQESNKTIEMYPHNKSPTHLHASVI